LKGSAAEKKLTAALKNRRSTEFEYFHSQADKWFLVRGYPTRNRGLWVFFHDITARKQTELETQTAHQRTFEILESISDGFFAVDDEWRLTYVNARAEKAWSRRREALLGKVMWHEFAATVGTEFFAKLQRAKKQSFRFRFITEFPPGQMNEVEVHPCAGGLCVYFRPALPGAASRAAAWRSALREQLEAAREEERERIACELHDGIGSMLAALSIRIAGIELAKDLKQVRLRVRHLSTASRRVFSELDRLLRGLHPAAVEDGLATALRALASEMAESQSVRVSLDTEALNGLKMSSATEMALYRIVQEALSNVVKHSGAKTVAVEFRYAAPTLSLEIRDDGHGLSPGNGQRARRKRLGLHTMRERARALGGQLVVATQRGRGTRVVATVPVLDGAAAA
jgi:signal transduction histidine kinase